MNRREFCRMAAAAAAMPHLVHSADAQQSKVTPGYNKYTEDYAAFCAKPERDRVFYAFQNGEIISEKLTSNNWNVDSWASGKADLPVPGGSWQGVPMVSPIPGLEGHGPFQANWDSLLQYDVPEWYRDAKFGIWTHWSPQCVAEAGDWYASGMYGTNPTQFKFQLEHFGHPSKFGYKDLCAQWTLLNWHPDDLMGRFKRAGARIFLSLANHHDGFDTWDSKYQPWNSANIGPHRDVIGDWAKSARRHGLRFGVTVHQGYNWWFFQPAYDSDKSGPLTGISYDGRLTMADGKGTWWEGLNPQILYGVKHPVNALPDISFVKNFYDRTRDLVDQHDPDLLYFDSGLFPLGWGGMNIAAYFYNHNLKTRGRMEGILNVKDVPDRLAKAVVADYERGITSEIKRFAWQSETCIGDWHYNRAKFEAPGEYGTYMNPRDVLHWMIDTVSKNGTFILNIPGKPDGTIDSKEIAILDQIGAWMEINGEAIYETRPWKICGEGANGIKGGSFDNSTVQSLGTKDIRFTQNKANTVIYAFVLGWPAEPFTIQALGLSAPTQPGKIRNVELLGTCERLKWEQKESGLQLHLIGQQTPVQDYAAVLKLSLT